MEETFTQFFNSTTNTFEMKELSTLENIETEESVFYKSICADLDLLVKSPKPETVQNILNHSSNSL